MNIACSCAITAHVTNNNFHMTEKLDSFLSFVWQNLTDNKKITNINANIFNVVYWYSSGECQSGYGAVTGLTASTL